MTLGLLPSTIFQPIGSQRFPHQTSRVSRGNHGVTSVRMSHDFALVRRFPISTSYRVMVDPSAIAMQLRSWDIEAGVRWGWRMPRQSNSMVRALSFVFALELGVQSRAGRFQVTTFPSPITTMALPITLIPQISIPVSMVNRGSPDLRSKIVIVFPYACVTAAAAVVSSTKNPRM